MKPTRRVQRGFRVRSDWVPALANVRFVLVATTHPGNIGAVSRVVKNMGMSNLTLVSSTDSGPETEAFSMASGAYEMVENATRVTSLAEALADTVMALGTSSRLGSKRTSAVTPDEVAPVMLRQALTGPVACVFGRESRGLTNEELKLCTHHVIIPTDAEFASMNIAHAAAVMAYELFKAACVPVNFQATRIKPASVESREQMFEHIQDVLVRSGFLEESNPLRMMRDVRRILNSATMDDRDVKIVRGMFRRIDNALTASRPTSETTSNE